MSVGYLPPMVTRRKSYEYLLGDSPRESARLRAQAELWDPVAHALFDRLGIRRRWKVLEVGPGRGSLHMELRRRVGGPVDAVERSPVFAGHLRALQSGDGLGEGRIWECDLIDTELPQGHYDLIFARWVFLFLPRPQEHLKMLARALKPGGLLALQDYHRETMALVPSPPEWADFAAADGAFFASQGGDASIGGKLPRLMRRAGLAHVETVPTLKVGHPGSGTWDWMSEYFLGVMQRYAAFAPFTPEKGRRLSRTWRAAAKDPSSLLVAPTVLDVVGRKRR